MNRIRRSFLNFVNSVNSVSYRNRAGNRKAKFSSFAGNHLLKKSNVRKIILICLGFLLCGLRADAESFTLSDGRTVTGEVLMGSANDNGLQVRIDDNQYERIPWSNFTQDDLKKFQQNPKLASMVEPFIEVTQEERLKKTEVTINPVPRLERPPPQSLSGAMFSTGLGTVILLLLYAANLYAAFEVAMFRARPAAVVCGVSAVLPVIGPIIFLCLPTLIDPNATVEEVQPESVPGEGVVAVAAGDESSPLAPDPATAAANPGGLHISHAEAPAAEAALPQTQIFQRGAFTFNRRFFETKFAPFFGVVRRDTEKDLVMVIKAARGEYHGTRISRISGNDLHLQVTKGNASEEVMIPFTEIKEVQLKHKDAK
jgi:hypothetical protein